MMNVMRLLNLPVPIFAAALVQGVDPPAVTGPGWFVAIFTGAFVVLWFLNVIGKLPGAIGSERRGASFRDADRTKLDAVHEIVTAEDAATRPRWPRVWAPMKETLETHELVRELAELRATWERERRS